MRASEALGTSLARLGVTTAFGLAGSGNFLLINAMRAAGIGYHGACHEAGAVAMADGYARASGEVGVATVHQGPGVTNALTALAEAVRSATPLILLAPEAPTGSRHANQALDQLGVVRSVGADATRLEDPAAIPECVAGAYRRAVADRRSVALILPLAELERTYPPAEVDLVPGSVPSRPAPSAAALDELANALAAARRPLILAGRGAVGAGAGAALRRLAERAGALLSTTLVAKGLFARDPYAIGFVGGLASPLASELAEQSDLVLGFGTSLSGWATCGGRVPAAGARLALIDDDPASLARHPKASPAVLADAALAAGTLADIVEVPGLKNTWRTPELAARIARDGRATGARAAGSAPHDSDRESRSAELDRVDPEALTLELDRLLPENRLVALDSGHFAAFPSMHLDVADGRAFLFAQGFQAVGLGLGVAIGAAVGRPDRVVLAILGDGGAKMSLLELDTAVRHRLPVVVAVFDDGGYGAEVHDFEPLGVPVDIARFPSRDYAAVARGVGARAVSVRGLDDLGVLRSWLEAPEGPIVLDCKVDPKVDAAAAMTEAGAAEWSMAPTVASA